MQANWNASAEAGSFCASECGPLLSASIDVLTNRPSCAFVSDSRNGCAGTLPGACPSGVACDRVQAEVDARGILRRSSLRADRLPPARDPYQRPCQRAARGRRAESRVSAERIRSQFAAFFVDCVMIRFLPGLPSRNLRT